MKGTEQARWSHRRADDGTAATSRRPPPATWAPSALLALATLSCNDVVLHGHNDVVLTAVQVSEQFVQAPLPAVDVLWVIDDTPSMADEQANLEAAMADFIDALLASGLSWQLGVISTDITRDDAGVLQGSPWIVTPILDDPSGVLEDSTHVGTDGVEPAGGLGAAWLALTDPLDTTANHGFRRDNAALHVIVFSDGDDGSQDILGDDPASAFLDLLAQEQARAGADAILSAIVGDRLLGCQSEAGIAVAGDTYLDVAQASGGASASICDPDLTDILDTLAQISASWPDTFALQASPIPDSVRVQLGDTRKDDGWTLQEQPPAIVFDAPPAAGAVITVDYQVAE